MIPHDSKIYSLNGRRDVFKFALAEQHEDQWELVLMEYVVPGIGMASSTWGTVAQVGVLLDEWGAVELSDANLKTEVFNELHAVQDGTCVPRYTTFDWSVVGGKPELAVDTWLELNYWDESDEFQPKWAKIDTQLKEGSYLLVVAKSKANDAKLLKKTQSLQEIEQYLHKQDFKLNLKKI